MLVGHHRIMNHGHVRARAPYVITHNQIIEGICWQAVMVRVHVYLHVWSMYMGMCGTEYMYMGMCGCSRNTIPNSARELTNTCGVLDCTFEDGALVQRYGPSSHCGYLLRERRRELTCQDAARKRNGQTKAHTVYCENNTPI